ncbi:hypothetical protein, partial [Pseudoflavonifractor sp. 60]|uniref:hypothetical protein n=1 Tax=Pseudoflavonifractor sp. 60 TaxID=2304576 RepID=UPI001A9ABF11
MGVDDVHRKISFPIPACTPIIANAAEEEKVFPKDSSIRKVSLVGWDDPSLPLCGPASQGS